MLARGEEEAHVEWVHVSGVWTCTCVCLRGSVMCVDLVREREFVCLPSLSSFTALTEERGLIGLEVSSCEVVQKCSVRCMRSQRTGDRSAPPRGWCRPQLERPQYLHSHAGKPVESPFLADGCSSSGLGLFLSLSRRRVKGGVLSRETKRGVEETTCDGCSRPATKGEESGEEERQGRGRGLLCVG